MLFRSIMMILHMTWRDQPASKVLAELTEKMEDLADELRHDADAMAEQLEKELYDDRLYISSL